SFLLSDESPWRRGFGSSKDVEIVKRKGVVIGFVGSNTNVDPSVLVSLLNFISRKIMMSEMYGMWNQYRKVGMTPQESTLALMLISGSPLVSYQGLKFSDSYYLPICPDLKAMMTGETQDLTGRTWRAGGDYNRK